MGDLKLIKKRWRDHLRGGSDGPNDFSIGLAGSFTLDPVIPYLGGQLLGLGFDRPEVRNAGYNQIIQTCLSPNSGFGDQPLDLIALIWRLEDLADIQNIDSVIAAIELLEEALERLCSEFNGAIILSLPPRPSVQHSVIVKFSQPRDDLKAWHHACMLLMEKFADRSRVHFVDLEDIVSGLGNAAHDSRKYFLYRQPYTEDVYGALGESIARIVRARKHEPKKCLVLDCDNTLWGGIVGEDGVGGVQIGDDYPGSVFKTVQRQVRELKESGVFIAVSSKNNEEDAFAVFERRPEMVLRKEDIIVSKIDWRPKSENMKEIAVELNIGLDALVFVDDNPFEIEEVKANAPGVECIQVPEELADYPAAMVAAGKLFDRLVITDDDRKRVVRMRSEKDRKDVAQKLTPEEFLAQLELRVYVYQPEAEDLARVAQLINKTNQFNVLTRRHTLEEVTEFVQNEKNLLFCMAVADKFGEYGLVGVVMLSDNGEEWRIENFLMSCRVLGRGVETTLFAHIGDFLSSLGASHLRGGYASTPKNKLVADLYERHGFVRSSDSTYEQTGVEEWISPLPGKSRIPDYVELHSSRPQLT
ncbi:MAG: HAD-IIIC family phosphatase [Pseudomonadota bacterium]